MATSCRTFLKGFGVNVITEFTNITDLIDNPEPYLMGAAGYSAIFLICTVILIVYFFLGIILSCCPCMQAKMDKKFTWCGTIPHIIASIICLVGIILYFFSGSTISKGLQEAGEIPVEINGTFNSVDKTIFLTVNSTFNTIDVTLNKVITSVNVLLDVVGDSLKNIKLSVDKTEKSIKEDKNLFNNTVTPHLRSLNDKVKDVVCFGKPLGIDLIPVIDSSNSAFNKIINSVETLSSSFGQIEEFKKEAQKAVNEVLDENLKKEIDKYKIQIPQLSKSFSNVHMSIQDPVDNVGSILNEADVYLNLVAWISVSIFAVLLGIFIISYFFNCCFSRFIASTFWIWGLILVILIGIPSVIFALLYVILMDVCPVLESNAAMIIQDALPEADIEAMLKCPNNLPNKDLYRILSLDKQFNYSEVMDSIEKMASETIESIADPELLEKLKEAAELNPPVDINISTIFSFDLDWAKKTIDIAKKGGCSAIKDGYDADIAEIEKGLNKVTEELGYTLQLALQFYPFLLAIPNAVADSINSVDDIIKYLTNGLEENLDAAIDSLNCDLVCSVYAPAKNAVCAHIVDGSVFWQLSAIFFAVGLTLMSCTMCTRRRGMGSFKNNSVSAEEMVSDQKSEEDETENSISDVPSL